MLLVLVLVTTPTIPACRSKFSQKPPTPDLRRKIQKRTSRSIRGSSLTQPWRAPTGPVVAADEAEAEELAEIEESMTEEAEEVEGVGEKAETRETRPRKGEKPLATHLRPGTIRRVQLPTSSDDDSSGNEEVVLVDVARPGP